MSKVQIDPQFESYLRDKPSLSYVKPDDTLVRRVIVDKLELALGRRRIETIYAELKQDEFSITTFFRDALTACRIEINHIGRTPTDLRVGGPVIFLANHPFGIIDGLVLCDIAAQLYGDLRIVINAALCQDRVLAPYFLPIDFDDSTRAISTNIRTKQIALESLSAGIPLLIFPSGMVSTASNLGFGPIKDAPWTTFAAKLIRASEATVVPIYFHGGNSRKFHIGSHIAQSLRAGMLIHEAINKFDTAIEVNIGAPIAWTDLKAYTDRKTLTVALYEKVQELGRSPL